MRCSCHKSIVNRFVVVIQWTLNLKCVCFAFLISSLFAVLSFTQPSCSFRPASYVKHKTINFEECFVHIINIIYFDCIDKIDFHSFIYSFIHPLCFHLRKKIIMFGTTWLNFTFGVTVMIYVYYFGVYMSSLSILWHKWRYFEECVTVLSIHLKKVSKCSGQCAVLI